MLERDQSTRGHTEIPSLSRNAARDCLADERNYAVRFRNDQSGQQFPDEFRKGVPKGRIRRAVA